MRTVAAAFVLFLLACTASAQVRYIDHRTYPADFSTIQPGDPVADRPGLVWRHDGRGWFHEVAGASTPIPQNAPGLVDCPNVNPYDDPDAALACNLQQIPKDVPKWLPTFRVGQRYFGAYSDFQMIVIGIARSVDQVEVVTFQWTADSTRGAAGDVDACRNDGKGAFNSCGTWIPHPPAP